MRYATACVRCRTLKRRCRRTASNTRCQDCARSSLECSLQTDARAPNHGTRHETSRDGPVHAMGDAMVLELVRTYISCIHDRPHSLFHVPTLWRALEAGDVPTHLLASLCAFGAKLSTRPSIRQKAAELTASAKMDLAEKLEDVSLDSVRTCILLANLYAAELQTASEALYFAMANRMALMLKLDQVDPADRAVVREVKSRIWWTLIMADNWCSAGLGIPRQLSQHAATVSPPIDEFEFHRWAPEGDVIIPHGLRSGLWTYMIQLVELFAEIHDLNRISVHDGLNDETCDARVRPLAHRLDAWEAALPSHLCLNDSNMDEHERKGLGGPFVALHLGYHHYSTLLYFRYLDSRVRDNQATADIYALRCRGHACMFSDLVRQSRERKECKAIYAVVGHMTVVSAVHLHSLLFGYDQVQSRTHLVSNFATLVEMKRYWPCLEQSIGRLLLFQNDCLRSASANTHRIDAWMMRYLLEHSLPLHERVMPAPHDFAFDRERATTQALARLYAGASADSPEETWLDALRQSGSPRRETRPAA